MRIVLTRVVLVLFVLASTCLAADDVFVRCWPEQAPRRNAVARVIPSAGRVVGLLEWVEAHLAGDDERLDPTQSELLLRGPDGPVAGALTREGHKLKFVPAGTRRLELSDPAVVRAGEGFTVTFEGNTIAADARVGPDGQAWRWALDGDDANGGRFDLYRPSGQVGYARYQGHTLPIAGVADAGDGEHTLTLVPAEPHPDRPAKMPTFWDMAGAMIHRFIVSPLAPGEYTATVVTRDSEGQELARRDVPLFVDPVLARQIRATLASDGYYNVSKQGHSPQIEVAVVNDTSAPANVRPVIEITDYWENVAQLQAESRLIPAGAAADWSITWTTPSGGWYLWNLRIESADGTKLLREVERTAAVLPAAEDRILGVPPYESVHNQDYLNGAYGEDPEHLLHNLQLAGIQGVHNRMPSRDNDTARLKYGLQPGVDAYTGPVQHHTNWLDVRSTIAKMKQDAKAAAENNIPGGLYSCGDEINTFGTYNYSIWAAGQKLNALYVRRVDPQARFAPTQSGASLDLDLPSEMALRGAWPYVDFLNLHFYYEDTAALTHMLDCHAWLSRLYGEKPMVLGLWNTAAPAPPTPLSQHPFEPIYLSSLRNQASRGVRQRTYIRRYPWVETIWHWNGYDWRDTAHHAMLFWNKTPKPLFVATAVVSWKLGGVQHVGTLTQGPVILDVFDRAGQAVIVVTGGEGDVALDGFQGPVEVTNIMGHSRALAADGTLRLHLDPQNPLFIEPADGGALLARAADSTQRQRAAEAYWRKHLAVLYTGHGRGTRRGEIIVPAGTTHDLAVWVINEGARPVRGSLAFSAEVVEHRWYGGAQATLHIEPGKEQFTVGPGQQALIPCKLSAAAEAQTYNATFRTQLYIHDGPQRIFIDPIRIDAIIVATPKPPPQPDGGAAP